ncbi:GNAT family N-acetyltransferase [Alterisphingorhabdus coralli]|uniref:GNAT family N-acetyltransferase n=1 Tax=Alterisphingorhabdus coralli TaxID=3071408 RepID=A0AA97FAB6_9SPHN|nr:GNAT family N-acetyltransferase [Parasphingorhabdus sp. SCSIO 66989]WOE76058.1 GNAT family N-acetyltransferase [Parasphingorhabdus sp. SCSIO 66989]
MTEISIIPYTQDYCDRVIALAIRSWMPVFGKTRDEVPSLVYDNFYPAGWQMRQAADIRALLHSEPENFWLALHSGSLAGFLGMRMHPEDNMGEIHLIAVEPELQRQSIGRQLMAFAEDRIRSAGMKMVMLETVGDSGHMPARKTYEAMGYKTWPVARYFKKL